MKLICSGKIILASASPRRRELLGLLGVDFEVIVGGVDENACAAGSPQEMVRLLALKKAETVAAENVDAWVLGADTVVVLGDEVIGKPTDKDDVLTMLGKLSGKTHIVYTGFAIVGKRKGVEVTQVVESRVTFCTIGEEEIIWYAECAEPYDKAGAYALQGRGAMFVSEIAGSYTNVIGLPLSEVVGALIKLGAIGFVQGQGE